MRPVILDFALECLIAIHQSAVFFFLNTRRMLIVSDKVYLISKGFENGSVIPFGLGCYCDSHQT